MNIKVLQYIDNTQKIIPMPARLILTVITAGQITVSL